MKGTQLFLRLMDERELAQNGYPEACIEICFAPALNDKKANMTTIQVTELQLIELVIRIHELLPQVHVRRARVWETASRRMQTFESRMKEVSRDVAACMPEVDLLHRVLDGLRTKEWGSVTV